jgi:spore coat protein U-like protein
MSRLSSRSLLLTAAVSGLALGGALWVKPALAETATANLTVSANVPANCTITANALSFGAYDPTSASNLTGTGSITTNCTNGAAVTITLNQGQNPSASSTDAVPQRRLANGSNYLDYSLFQNSNRTTTWGNTVGTAVAITGNGQEQISTVYGQMQRFQTAAPGNYSDTVVATVTF